MYISIFICKFECVIKTFDIIITLKVLYLFPILDNITISNSLNFFSKKLFTWSITAYLESDTQRNYQNFSQNFIKFTLQSCSWLS